MFQSDQKNDTVILGGGLTGLSAGYVLTKAGLKAIVFESDSSVGGLSKTIIHNGFRFDLGGHRFFTMDRNVEKFVRNLLDGELITVSRKSKIFMRDRYFDYPLRPLNAFFGLGLPTTARIFSDYGIEKVKKLWGERERVSLEDWVIGNFGRKMFSLYFKEYSEKVWGIDCSRISGEWVSQRISGLSLGKAVKNAFRFKDKNLPTLADRFLYPEYGIGRISDRLAQEIERGGEVFTDTRAESINHSGFEIKSVSVGNHSHSSIVRGRNFVSSIPITKLVNMLNPPPPENILAAASKLRFRDLIIVTVMIDRRRVSDQSWIYVPERKIPFGRIHEPTNWSEKMAPEGKTLVVTEFFSFRGDAIWNKSDRALSDITVEHLERLGFIQRREVLDSVVMRVPNAYPLFEVGYEGTCGEIYRYLNRFGNLSLAGRAGMFRYYNMDHAIESGIECAEKIIAKQNQAVRSQESEVRSEDVDISALLNSVS